MLPVDDNEGPGDTPHEPHYGCLRPPEGRCFIREHRGRNWLSFRRLTLVSTKGYNCLTQTSMELSLSLHAGD